jgi:hypothetical protein
MDGSPANLGYDFQTAAYGLWRTWMQLSTVVPVMIVRYIEAGPELSLLSIAIANAMVISEMAH